MNPQKNRFWSPDKKYWFDKLAIGETRLGWNGLEITTSFQVDGTDYFKLSEGDAYFKDNNTFIIFDYRGVVIYYLNTNEVIHFFRTENDEVTRNLIKLDIKDPQKPIMKVYEEGKPEKSYDLFSSLKMFSPGRGFF